MAYKWMVPDVIEKFAIQIEQSVKGSVINTPDKIIQGYSFLINSLSRSFSASDTVLVDQ